MRKPLKHRGIASGTKGMAAAAHGLITQSGMNVLNKGGHAADAAIAMALTSGVVLPDMCSLGGDVFALYYDAESDTVTAVNASGPAPKNTGVSYLKQKGCTQAGPDGIDSVTVPGAVDAYFAILEKWGTMSFGELAEDAVRLCEDGVPVSEKVVRHMHTDLNRMKSSPALAALWLKDGEPYQPFDIVKNPDLAETLRYLAETGRDGFYKGKIRDSILACSKAENGCLCAEDFEGSFTEFLEPISVCYRGHTLYQTPPVSQGIIHLEEMGILSHFDLAQYGGECAETVHLMTEAKKLAFADRRRYFADPRFHQNPTEAILSEDCTKKLAGLIKADRCLQTEDFRDHLDGDTTSFLAVDKDGNAFSFIHSVSNTWGSLLIPEGTGFLLNNRGAGFTMDENDVNCIAPGKRTMHTLNTWMIRDPQGRLKYSGNTPGGDNQPQWNMQAVVNLLDFDMNVQEALEYAKWSDLEIRGRHILRIEEQIGKKEIEKLREMGHEVDAVPAFSLTGAGEIIEITENGVRLGASDPRADGCAAAQI